MNTAFDIYEKYKKPIDELIKINPELGNFYKGEFLKKEAKKRGYKAGVIIMPVNEYNTKLTIASDLFKITDCGGLNVFNNDGSIQYEQNTFACLYADGKWATILPEQKNIITKEKALKIIAKKLKVSPENIEIK